MTHRQLSFALLMAGALLLPACKREASPAGPAVPRDETAETLGQLMIGRALPRIERRPHQPGEALLSLRSLSMASDDPFGTALQRIDLDVHAGEIVGIAGVSGNGQAELLAALSGEVRAPLADAIRLNGRAVGRMGAATRRRLGLAFVPEERLGRGAVPAMSLTDNALLGASGTAHLGLLRGGWIRRGALRRFASLCIDRFNVKAGGPDAVAQSLSGGNLQKFIVGREILQEPRVLVVAQPTWGVDVGAASFIRQQLLDLSARGVAVLVLSEELDELFEICDRITVLAQGRLSPVRQPEQTDSREIGLWSG